MRSLLQRFGSSVLGFLHGFDRLRFRGSKRLPCTPGGVTSSLAPGPVPLKEYKAHARPNRRRLCRSIETEAKRSGLYHSLNDRRIASTPPTASGTRGCRAGPR